MINTNQVLNSNIQIGNFVVPCFAWTVDIGSYGQLGKAVVHTSIAMLRQVGINLNTLNSQVQGSTASSNTPPSNNNIPCLISVNGATIFGGYYTHGHFMFGMHSSTAEILIRDYSCVLFDSKTSIVDLTYEGVTINDFVTQVCALKGLQPVVTSTLGANKLVGTAFVDIGLANSQGVINSSFPQSLWSLVVLLARSINAQVYTLPANPVSFAPGLLGGVNQNPNTPGMLVFEDVPSNPKSYSYTWKSAPVLNGPLPQPIMDIQLLHQPQRNNNFSVMVRSYHTATTETSIGQVTSIGAPVTVNSKNIAAGDYVGSAGANIRALLSNRALGIPLYEFFIPGLTASGVAEKAQAIASEISMRLFVANVLLDFNSDIMPGQQLIVNEETPGDLLGMAGQPLFIAGVRHSFEFPQGEEVGSTGMQTALKCLAQPRLQNALTPQELGALVNAPPVPISISIDGGGDGGGVGGL
jgi:hypothetical protein